jgi:hypothetical protein
LSLKFLSTLGKSVSGGLFAINAEAFSPGKVMPPCHSKSVPKED